MSYAKILLATFIAGLTFGLATAGCSDDGDNDSEECVEEGGSVAAVQYPPLCCDGLDLIPPPTDTVGVLGICTAKCGNGTCDTNTESAENCPDDCQ